MIQSFKNTTKDIQATPVTISLLGIHHIQEPVIRPNGLHIFQWFFCESGMGEIIIDHQKLILRSGEALLIYPDVPHSYRAHEGEWCVSFAGFTGVNTSAILNTFQMYASGVYHLHKRFNIDTYLQRFIAANKLSGSSKRQALSLTSYEMLFDLSQNIHYDHEFTVTSENETIRNIILYIEDNYARDFSLDDIAASVNRSKGYIQTLFKQEIGHTIGKHIETLRISKARILLLQNPEMKVCDIGEACGFRSPSYFGKVFKASTGSSPEEYRM